MDILYTVMSALIIAPWLALVPAALFGGLYVRRWSAFALVAALAWLIYGAYETGMALRWLCSGECNIRVDLLVIYPLLLLLSLAGLVSALRKRRP